MHSYIIKTGKSKDEVIDILKANTYELDEKSTLLQKSIFVVKLMKTISN